MSVRTNILDRQPSNIDFARPTQFRFDMLKIPNTQYHITEVNLPGLTSTGDAPIQTRFKELKFMGDVLDYEPLEITFIVQENLQNWREIHDWMVGYGFPENNEQFETAISDAEGAKNILKRGKLPNPNVLTSDATLTMLTNKNNPVIQIDFKNVYPSSLSALQFDTKDTETAPLTATVTFQYDIYNIKTL